MDGIREQNSGDFALKPRVSAGVREPNLSLKNVNPLRAHLEAEVAGRCLFLSIIMHI